MIFWHIFKSHVLDCMFSSGLYTYHILVPQFVSHGQPTLVTRWYPDIITPLHFLRQQRYFIEFYFSFSLAWYQKQKFCSDKCSCWNLPALLSADVGRRQSGGSSLLKTLSVFWTQNCIFRGSLLTFGNETYISPKLYFLYFLVWHCCYWVGDSLSSLFSIYKGENYH